MQAGGGEDLPIGLEIVEFIFCWTKEHIISEKIGRGRFIDDADVESEARVGTDVTIADPDFGELVQPGTDGGKDGVEMVIGHRLVKIIPMDGACGDLVVYDVAILGTTSGKGAGGDDQGSGVIELALPSAETLSDQFGWGKLIV